MQGDQLFTGLILKYIRYIDSFLIGMYTPRHKNWTSFFECNPQNNFGLFEYD